MAPRTTEQPLKVVAVRLPQSLIDEALRYADLYHSSVSELLREGLELRLRTRELPSMADGQGALSPGTVAMLHQLATTLATAAAAVRSVCQEGTAGETSHGHTMQQEEAYNGHTSLEDLSYNGNTSLDDETYNGNTVLMTSETVEPSLAVMRTAALAAMQEDPQPITQDIPAFDPVKHRLGRLCPQGHAWGTTGQSLRAKNKAGYCLACNAELSRAKRQRQAQPGA